MRSIITQPEVTTGLVATGGRVPCAPCKGTGALWPEGWARPLRYMDIQVDCRHCGGKGSVVRMTAWDTGRVQ